MALTQIQSEGIGDGEVKSADLENSGVTAGTYGSSSAIPAITVDAKGRITSASTNSINIDSTAITNGTSNVSVTNNSNVTVVNGGTTVGVFQSDGPQFNDNIKAKFGTGSDLQIYHNGSNSFIADAGTGVLGLKSNGVGVHFLNDAETEYLARFNVDSGCFLYHNGGLKLETTSTGIDVTGSVTCDNSLNVEGSTYGQIEVGGPSGAFIDLKGPNSDDYDFRLLTGGTGGEINVNGNNLSLYGHFVPGSNNAYDLGTSSVQWRNAYFDGTVRTDNLTCDSVANFNHGAAGAVTVAGNGDIRLGSGSTWTGETCKLQHHGNYLYIQGGVSGTIFRGNSGTDYARFDSSGHFRPHATNTSDLGTSTYRWRNVYTNDLNLSNQGGTNDVDGTWGSWTIQEGEDDLFLLNRRNGKKYKFNLTEVN